MGTCPLSTAKDPWKEGEPEYKPSLDRPGLRDFTDSTLNRNYVSPRTHALTDNFRNPKGMTKADKFHPALQQGLRVPAWIGGAAVGSAAGVANSVTNDDCECK